MALSVCQSLVVDNLRFRVARWDWLLLGVDTSADWSVRSALALAVV